MLVSKKWYDYSIKIGFAFKHSVFRTLADNGLHDNFIQVLDEKLIYPTAFGIPRNESSLIMANENTQSIEST